MTTVVITQPMLFPWPGFFEQLALADVYLYLDDAQFSKGSHTNRIQLKMGEITKWMTIPLAEKGRFQSISDLLPANGDFRTQHPAMLSRALAGAPYLGDAAALLDEAYAEKNLCALLIASVEGSARYLGLAPERRVLRTSTMDLPGRASDRVLQLVLAVGGTEYLTGHGAAGYLKHEAFDEAGVAVKYVNYSMTAWPQGAGAFTPYVSILDLIARFGPNARQYLASQTIPWKQFLATREVQSR